MKYIYYPGCSLHATGKSYDKSVCAVAKILGIELEELEDWNCCGATAYMSINELESFALSARNLALAEPLGMDIVAPCAACFTVLRKTNEYMKKFSEVKEKVNISLAAGNLSYKGTVRVRHMIDPIVNDVGLDAIKAKVRKPLKDLKVAAYYGCQVIRPKNDIDDHENPTILDRLVGSLGAQCVNFPWRVKCCGGSLMGTREDMALQMCKDVLLSAQQGGADCIVTMCPLCQMNLDGYQKRISKIYDREFSIPIVYFTQLIGVAFGLPGEELALKHCIVPVEKALAQYM